MSHRQSALALKVDVSNGQQVANMVERTVATFGRIDVLVNNAGILEMTPATELTETQWDRLMSINLKGQFLCSQAVGKQMIRQGQGKIVNIASASGHVAAPNQVAYCASKAGVILLTKALAVEWAKYKINVNSVSPARTATPLFEKALHDNPTVVGKGTARIPTGRVNRPEDVARAVMFLASSESDNVTGTDILVDGGACALFSGYVYPGE